jgi:hypothetical protein
LADDLLIEGGIKMAASSKQQAASKIVSSTGIIYTFFEKKLPIRLSTSAISTHPLIRNATTFKFTTTLEKRIARKRRHLWIPGYGEKKLPKDITK